MTGRSSGSDLPMVPGAAAETYAALGWRVVPIKDGAKYPDLKRWQEEATDDLETIRGWFADRPNRGVGVATGEGSGLWVLDVDIADGKRGAQNLQRMIADHGEIPSTVTARTGSGGLHFFFEWDPERPVDNGMSTSLRDRYSPEMTTTEFGLDIRGEGGQVIIAPTRHPDTGQLYRWIRSPFDVDVAPAPDWLYDLLQPLELVEEPPGCEPPEGGPETGGDRAPGQSGAPGIPVNLIAGDPDPSADSIADWVRSRFDFPTVLEQQGWTVESRRGDAVHYTRPGKDPRKGASAVLHNGGDGPLVVFSTEVEPLLHQMGRPTSDRSGTSLTLFDFLAATLHGGDRVALARQARSLERRERPAASRPGQVVALPGVDLEAVSPSEPMSGFVDVGRWWDDPTPAKKPDMLTTVDGRAILYADQLNWIHGDSGGGKTWVLLVAVAQLLREGRHVGWVHYEDPTPSTVLERLRLLGLERDEVVELFHYWDPQGEPLDGIRLAAGCLELGIEHVALDSIGEALNAAGVSEDSDAELGPWITGNLRCLVNEGIGVTVVDHAVKDTKSGARFHPSGSKRKRASVTGAGLLVEAVVAPTATTSGRINVLCAKDRHGWHRQGETVATLRVEHDIVLGGTSFVLTDPVDESEESGMTSELVALVAKVTANPGLSKTQVVDSLQMRKDAARELVELAISLGHLVASPGPQGSTLLTPA